MSESFYGGKAGFSFILQSNSFEGSNGIFSNLGEDTDTADINSLYGGIQRQDIKPGEYAIISEGDNKGEIYRVSFSFPPTLIYCGTIKTLKGEAGEPGPQGPPGEDGQDGKDGKDGEDGRAAHWYQGNGAPQGTYEDVAKGDMYLNKENGDVYEYKSNKWIYQQNVCGPSGEDGVQIDIETSQDEVTFTNSFYFISPNLGLIANGVLEDITVHDGIPMTLNGLGTSLFNEAYKDSIAYYDLSSVNARVDCIHIYRGGSYPPAIVVPKGTSALLGVPAPEIMSWSNAQKLSDNTLYIFLNQGILPISLSDHYSTIIHIGFRAFLKSGRTAQCSFCYLKRRANATNNNWVNETKICETGITLTTHDFYQNNQLINLTPKSRTQIEEGTGYAFDNAWDVITAFLTDGQRVLSII